MKLHQQNVTVKTMNVFLGKTTEKILEKVAIQNNLPIQEVRNIYIGFFVGFKSEMQKYNSEDTTTDFAIRLKHIGTFYNNNLKANREKWKNLQIERSQMEQLSESSTQESQED